MAEQSLKDKTIRGAGWSFADSIFTYGVTFIVGIILARLLGPEEYGLIGIITIFTSIFSSIVDSGFSNALIRKNNATETDYNTVFITNLVISLGLFFVLFFSAPIISNFFNEPKLTPLIKAMSSILIINAFAIVQRTLLVKKIDFKTQTKCSVISSVLSGIIGVAMAYLGCGVWALVAQQISRGLFNTASLWIFNKWLPNFSFSWASFKTLFSFGWKILVSGLINTIWEKVANFVIGKCYSTESLGQYTRASQFSDIFSNNLTAVVQRVSYPALSQIQDNVAHLKAAYKRVIKTTMLVSFTLLLGLAACAKALVLTLVGEQWLPCVPYLQIMCFSAMLTPLQAINLNMLQVQGRSDLFLKLEIIKKTIGVIPIMLGVLIGIYWMLIGFCFTSLIALYLNSYYSGPFLHYSVKEQIYDILPSFAGALLMSFGVFCISFLPFSSLWVLLLQLLAGFIITIGLNEIWKRDEYFEIKEIAYSFIRCKKL